jgi:hypothetical protein
MLPAVVDALPVCTVRKDCRWYSQEGGAACLRCPGVTTVSYDLSEEMQEFPACRSLWLGEAGHGRKKGSSSESTKSECDEEVECHRSKGSGAAALAQ